jgi:hypothetical protein
MSVNRDQNVASNTSSLLYIPLKKRKGSRFRASLSPSDGCNAKQEKKGTDTFLLTYHDQDISQASPVKKRICESSSILDDGDDDMDTVYVNPYLNHVGSNVISHEGETSHNLVSLIQKGSGQLSVSDLHSADQNQKAQANFLSSHKYFPIHDELCGIASDIDKPPCVIDLTRKASVHEHSEKSGKTASNMQFRSGERGHSLVSSLTQKKDCTLPISNLKKDKTAHFSRSSASCKYFPVLPESSDGLTINKVDYECSEISGDRTSGTQIKFDPTPSSVAWEDGCLIHNDPCSQKRRSSSSTSVGIYENGCLPTSVFDVRPLDPQFRTGFTPSLKLCENKLHASSKFGIKPKLSKNQSCAMPLSLKSYRSERYPGCEYAIETSSSKSVQLPESEPYSTYEFNIHSKSAQPKSGLASSVKSNEHDISPVFQLNAHAKTETLSSSVSQQSNSSKIFKDNDKQGGANNFLEIKMNCIKSNSSKKDQEMLVPKSKLHQFKHDLVHVTGRTSNSEIGVGKGFDTISKQESYCSYEKSQGNSKKQIGETKSTAGHWYQGEEMDTKEEQSSIENKEFQHKENTYVPKVSCDKSGIVPVTCKEVQNGMNHHRVVNQDINKARRKHSEEETTVCIDDIHTLCDEENNCRNSDYEGPILVTDDTDDDGISVHDISDSFEYTDDDIEIVHYVSKSDVGTRDFSVQQKELNCTNNPIRNRDFEDADQNIVSQPCDLSKVLKISKSSVKSNGYAIPNSAGNLINEQRDDAQWPYWKSVWETYRTSRAYDDSVTNAFRFQASTSMAPLCLKTYHQTPTTTRQVLPSGVHDLSQNTVIQSIGTPSSLSPVHNSFELPRGKLFSPFHSFKFPRRKSQNVSSPKYPSSSDVFRASSGDAGGSYTLPEKQDGCDRNLVPILEEHDESVWNAAIPNSSTNNLVTSNPNISVYCNYQETSSEPDNREEILVPLKVIPELTSVHETTLETSGVSHNLQEGKEIFQKEEILTSVSDSDGEKKQTSIAEDNTETTQKGPRHEWECAICLEAINSKRGISATMCGHVYCTPCITEVVYKRRECPTCRKALDSAQVHPLFIFG